jgi:SAM-dependent methyltransferase
MPGYAKNTAEAYNRLWGGYGRACAKSIHQLYLNMEHGRNGSPLLDLCCGTGELIRYFLDLGFSATGIDLSEHMLHHAERNCQLHVADGSATFILSDVLEFTVPSIFGLATCTYDSLNHLASISELHSVFVKVRGALLEGGLFVFDINTIRGLDDWNRIRITERDGYVNISRGFFDPAEGRAHRKFSGFYRVESGLFEQYSELIINTAFPVARISDELRSVGFKAVHTALMSDLSAPVSDPEEHDRVFFVAK